MASIPILFMVVSWHFPCLAQGQLQTSILDMKATGSVHELLMADVLEQLDLFGNCQIIYFNPSAYSENGILINSLNRIQSQGLTIYNGKSEQNRVESWISGRFRSVHVLNLLDSQEILEEYLQNVRSSNTYVFLLKDNDHLGLVENVHFLKDALIVKSDVAKKSVEIFAFDPYTLKEVWLDTWISNTGFVLKTPLKDRKTIHSNLNGKQLRVVYPKRDMAMYMLPYLHRNVETGEFNGKEYDILNYLSVALNFTYEMQVSIDERWGALVSKENNSWNGMIGMVQRQEADIALGALTITPSRSTVVDFSWPYLTSPILSFFAHEPPPYPQYLSLIWPLEPTVWLWILVSFVIFGLVSLIFLKCVSSSRDEWSLQKCLNIIFLITIEKGCFESDKKWPDHVRITFGVFALGVFVVTRSYSGMLISSLTTPVKTRQMETFEELANSDYFVQLEESSFSYGNALKNANTSATNSLYNRWKSQEPRTFGNFSLSSSNQIVLHYPKTVTFVDSAHLEYLLETRYSTPSGQTSGYIGKEKMFMSGYGFPMIKNHPLNESINKWIRRLLYFGLTVPFQDRAVRFEKKLIKTLDNFKPYNYKTDDKVGARSFTLDQLQGLFYLYILMICLSIVAFLAELNI